MSIYFVRNVFYDFKKTGTFGVPDRICRDTGTYICKIHKTGTVPGKLVRKGSLVYSGLPNFTACKRTLEIAQG
jgi:hypothetical protein